jgi:mannose-6-phosphate isomerase
VLPGKRLSYQRHERRREQRFVVSGRGAVTLEGSNMAVAVGDAVDVPACVAHRIASDGPEPLVFIEVQTGDYFGEDDMLWLNRAGQCMADHNCDNLSPINTPFGRT